MINWIMPQSQIPLDAVLKLLGYILGIMISLVGTIGWFVRMLHNDMKKSIEVVHLDLKPLLTQVAIHEEQIKEIKEDHKEINKWLNNHDGRIQTLERKIP